MRTRIVDKQEYKRLAILASKAVELTTFAEINTTEFDNFPDCEIKFVYETDFNATLKHYVDADILRTTYKILTPVAAVKISFGTKHKYRIIKNPNKGEITFALMRIVRDKESHVNALTSLILDLKKELSLKTSKKEEVQAEIDEYEKQLIKAVAEFEMFSKQYDLAFNTSQTDIHKYFCLSSYYRYYTYPIISITDNKGGHHSDHVPKTRINFIVLDDNFKFKKKRTDSTADEYFSKFKRVSLSGLYDLHYRELPEQLDLFKEN